MTHAQSLRGTVLRSPSTEPGLLFVDGRQLPFVQDGVWQSAQVPEPGLVVDVWLNENGQVTRVVAVDRTAAAREQAIAQSSALANGAAASAKNLIGRMGTVRFGLAVALLLLFFALPAYHLRDANMALPFWGLGSLSLRTFQSGALSHGLWSLLGLACLVAPFAAPYLASRRRAWLCAAPLVFILASLVRVAWIVDQAIDATARSIGGPQSKATATRLMADMFVESSGMYVVLLLAVALAFFAFRRLPAPAAV